MLKYQLLVLGFEEELLFLCSYNILAGSKNDLVFKICGSICHRNKPQKFGFHDAETIRPYFSLYQVPAFHAGMDVSYQCLLTVQLLADKCAVLVIKITAPLSFPFFPDNE